jgi:hypothetical protein
MFFNEKWHSTTIFTLVGWDKSQAPISYKLHDVNNDIIKKNYEFCDERIWKDLWTNRINIVYKTHKIVITIVFIWITYQNLPLGNLWNR